jgi:flagellar biosynthesis component FlhA
LYSLFGDFTSSTQAASFPTPSRFSPVLLGLLHQHTYTNTHKEEEKEEQQQEQEEEEKERERNKDRKEERERSKRKTCPICIAMFSLKHGQTTNGKHLRKKIKSFPYWHPYQKT